MATNRESIESLAVQLYEIGAVKIGRFRLHSGRESPIYIDLRIMASFPKVMRQAASAYKPILESLDFDLIAATPLAGLPIGTAISLEMNRPLIYPRQVAKQHGTMQTIEGRWLPGQRAVLIDDLVTSGDSLLQAFAILDSSGIVVSEAVVLIDREQGGRENLEDGSLRLHSAMSISQLLTILEDKEWISSQQRVEILASLV